MNQEDASAETLAGLCVLALANTWPRGSIANNTLVFVASFTPPFVCLAVAYWVQVKLIQKVTQEGGVCKGSLGSLPAGMDEAYRRAYPTGNLIWYRHIASLSGLVLFASRP